MRTGFWFSSYEIFMKLSAKEAGMLYLWYNTNVTNVIL